MNKKKVIFKCETITPLFLGEAVVGKVELRPPPIKAAIRFWWRAMHSHLSLTEMRNKERGIYGGIEKNAAKSAIFDIIVSEINNRQKTFDYTNGDNQLKIEDIGRGANTGLQYLLYSLIVLKKKGKYYPPKTEFDITFYFDSENEDNSEVLASFWLLVFFGNLGQRSRRGVGSFKVLSIEGEKNLCSKIKFICPGAESIKEEFHKILKLFNQTNTPQNNNTFSNLFNTNVYISSSQWDSWDKALDNIGMEMKKIRLKDNHGCISKNKAAYFGLPIRDRNKRMYKPVGFTRRASPLIIKIIKTIEPLENNYKWILIHLDGDFLPKDEDELNFGGKADPSKFFEFINGMITNNIMTRL